MTYNIETFFEALQFKPEIASEGWARAFVRDYALVREHGPGPDLRGYVHDPELGWDTPGRLRATRTYATSKPAGVFRVLAIGDSFTYGAEVEADQTYSSYLEQTLASGEVLNMGVTAYGIDQAALKYLKYGRHYRPDVVVFAIFGPDYVRTPLTFFRFAKPRFRLDPAGDLVLTGTPIPSPQEVYRRLRRTLSPMTYTAALLRSAYYSNAESSSQESYYEHWDPLVEKILDRVLEAAAEDGSAVVFLYIPTGSRLASNSEADNYCCDRGHLLRIWRRLAEKYPSTEVIDLMELLPRQYSRKVVYEQMIIHHDPKPTGHLTPFGNQAVAKVLAQHLSRKHGTALSVNAALDR
jgi:hypothetical protein